MAVNIENNRIRFRLHQNRTKVVDISMGLGHRQTTKADIRRLLQLGTILQDLVGFDIEPPTLTRTAFARMVSRTLDDSGFTSLVSIIRNAIEEESRHRHQARTLTTKPSTLLDILKAYSKSKHFALGKSQKNLIRCTSLMGNLIRYLETAKSLRNTKVHEAETGFVVDYVEWRSKAESRSENDLRKSPVSRDTIKKEVALLKEALVWSSEANKHPLPSWNIKSISKSMPNTQKVVVGLTLERQKRLLESLETDRKELRDLTLFYLATGLRLGEIHSIKVEKDCIVVFPDGTKGKTANANRVIPLYDSVKSVIEYHGLSNLQRLSLTFGKRLRERDASLHPHMLRHTFACNHLIASGGLNHLKLSQMLGHANSDFTYKQYSDVFRRVNLETEQTAYLDWLRTIQSADFLGGIRKRPENDAA